MSLSAEIVLKNVYQEFSEYGFWKEFAANHVEEQVVKNTVLIEAGKTSRYYWVVKEGLIRSYVLSVSGDEVTTGFYSKGQIALEFSSFFLQLPAKESLISETDTVVYKIEKKCFFEWFHRKIQIQEWGRNWMVSFLMERQNNYLESHTLSAPDRYKMLLESNRDIIKFAALKHIASYLNITDSTLSRIRKNV